MALDSGLIGSGLFVAFFLSTMLAVLRATRLASPLPHRAAALDNVGRGLAAGLAGIAVTIATVSSIGVISWLYWAYAGICVAYVRVVQAEAARKPQPPPRQATPDPIPGGRRAPQ
ncbi:hypothetical protein [Ramlibacter sp.]|uniref:hypothetical protein n=1 Tax=Ramlibacter sp. TaxID=1917967 RepID=UPI00262021E9|nr:hypothetical protein [Ramlibacter sp.]